MAEEGRRAQDQLLEEWAAGLQQQERLRVRALTYSAARQNKDSNLEFLMHSSMSSLCRTPRAPTCSTAHLWPLKSRKPVWGTCHPMLLQHLSVLHAAEPA